MTTIRTFREFVENIIMEALHPELHDIVTMGTSQKNKKTLLANKIKELSERGEKTGIEGNMPAGSSRAYMRHADPYHAVVDGENTKMITGTKVAITGPYDHFYKKTKHYEGLSLGQLQNEAENGDHFSNEHYRTLTHRGGNTFESNENGIFPPLIEHDEENHNWSHLGHAANVSQSQFRQHTQCETHPLGIKHEDFCSALERAWNQDHGRYHKLSNQRERELDHVERHPLVEKFLDHQRMFSAPPHDYRQIGNMGLWEHPNTGKLHIVARDSGFNAHVQDAYKAARDQQDATPVKKHDYSF